MRLRSMLYVPAHSERFLARAHERGADAIILDLEDAVPEVDKDRARDGLADAVKSVSRNGALVFVRINPGTARAMIHPLPKRLQPDGSANSTMAGDVKLLLGNSQVMSTSDVGWLATNVVTPFALLVLQLVSTRRCENSASSVIVYQRNRPAACSVSARLSSGLMAAKWPRAPSGGCRTCGWCDG